MSVEQFIAVKKGMKSVYKDDLEIPCTEFSIPENVVIGKKTQERDGYDALQVAVAGSKKNKPLLGILKDTGLDGVSIIREVKGKFELKKGDKIRICDFISPGEKVDVIGVSKGKGFAGTRKRWNFKGGPKTHGQSNKYNSPGSIGASSFPSRVIPGLKMAGRMGGKRVTVKNLEVIEVDKKNNKVLVKGAVPGNRGSYVIIRKAGKNG